MKKLFSAVMVEFLLVAVTSCKNDGTSDAGNDTSLATLNKQAGEEYIAKQMQKDKSFVKTETGVCYKVLQEGEGECFADTATVDVIYVGKDIYGNEFDNSKGEIVKFDLRRVVPGFREVIQLMKPGSKVLAIIPGDQAYGSSGSGPIGPNETLVFEIKTVGISQEKQN